MGAHVLTSPSCVWKIVLLGVHVFVPLPLPFLSHEFRHVNTYVLRVCPSHCLYIYICVYIYIHIIFDYTTYIYTDLGIRAFNSK